MFGRGFRGGGCWGFTTVPVTKTIRLSEWVTPGGTAIPGMTSLKDGDLQHSSFKGLEKTYRLFFSFRNVKITGV